MQYICDGVERHKEKVTGYNRCADCRFSSPHELKDGLTSGTPCNMSGLTVSSIPYEPPYKPVKCFLCYLTVLKEDSVSTSEGYIHVNCVEMYRKYCEKKNPAPMTKYDYDKLMKTEIELEALRCEREGMVAENLQRSWSNNTPAYTENDFNALAEQIRELGQKFEQE